MQVLTGLTDIIGKVAGTVLTPDQIELNGLIAFGLPDFAAQFLQEQRKWLGWQPITNPSSLGIAAMVAALIFAGIVALVYKVAITILSIYSSVILGYNVSKFQIVIFCLTFGFLISFAIYYFFVKSALVKSNKDPAGDIQKFMDGLIEPFVNPSSSPETSLLNLQMLGVKQAAYIGPSESDGSFDTAVGIQSALKMGVRFFTLQIGFLETKKDSTNFEEPFLPTLLYRDDSGKLISTNSGSINEVAKSLAAYAFSDSLLSGSQPLIVYLHFERAPNSLRDPQKYIQFLSGVAKDLQPLQEYMLKNSSSGNYQRQMNETGLIGAELKNFEKKVIIFSNVDTSIFRNTKTLGMEAIDTQYDLDFMVNMRVYLENANDSLGASDVPHNGEMPNAVIVSSKSVIGLTDDEKDAFALKGKTRFVIVMPSQMKNPSLPAINLLLERNSVNCILLNLFGEDIDILKGKVKAWKGEPFYSVKPVNYQASLTL